MISSSLAQRFFLQQPLSLFSNASRTLSFLTNNTTINSSTVTNGTTDEGKNGPLGKNGNSNHNHDNSNDGNQGGEIKTQSLNNNSQNNTSFRPPSSSSSSLAASSTLSTLSLTNFPQLDLKDCNTTISLLDATNSEKLLSSLQEIQMQQQQSQTETENKTQQPNLKHMAKKKRNLPPLKIPSNTKKTKRIRLKPSISSSSLNSPIKMEQN